METILIVDDEIQLLTMVQMRLEANGYEVISANDGLKGLEAAKTGSPDLILMDIVMPGIDGIEVSRILKNTENTKHIPIVVITASSSKPMEDECLKLGCSDVIHKPYDSAALLKLIKDLIGQ